jgi:pimeloyl-ACP methyl ester carboxylesterase
VVGSLALRERAAPSRHGRVLDNPGRYLGPRPPVFWSTVDQPQARRQAVGDVVGIDEHRARQEPRSGFSVVSVSAPAPPATAGARWVSRVAPAFHLSVARELRASTARDVVERHPVWAEPPLDARELPAVLVGGLAETGEQLEEWLTRLNCHVRIAATGFGVDCGERTVARVTEQVSTLVEERGQRCLLIGHSRGGQFARAIGVRRPELVQGLVVLGCPLNRMLGVHPWLKAEVALLGLAGTLGLPGLLRPSCLWGACCRRLRDDLDAPFPDGVPFLSLFSKQDRTVAWRSSLDPGARHREVSATHSGLLTVPEVYEAIAEELRRVTAGSRLSLLR